jgi:hypothetical protein
MGYEPTSGRDARLVDEQRFKTAALLVAQRLVSKRTQSKKAFAL